MAKRTGRSPKKSARDRAVEAAIQVAMQSTGSDGPILVQRTGLTAKSEVDRKAKPQTESLAVKSRPPTAIALALSKAGLAPQSPPAATRNELQPAKHGNRENLDIQPRRATQKPEIVTPRNVKPPVQKLQQKTAKSQKEKRAAKPTARKIRPPKQAGLNSARGSAVNEARSARMQERIKEAVRIIDRINYASPDELLALWIRYFGSAQDKNSNFQDLAKDYVEAIESEWRRRTILARLDPDHFDWPSTRAIGGGGMFASIEHAEGILGYLGYHVGKTGEPSAMRRQTLLSRVFEGPLPPINGPEYMKEWNGPGSPARLKKMAESIASAVKSAKRRNHADYSVAIEHWEDDLRYLYQEYYVARFGFDWPVQQASNCDTPSPTSSQN